MQSVEVASCLKKEEGIGGIKKGKRKDKDGKGENGV